MGNRNWCIRNTDIGNRKTGNGNWETENEKSEIGDRITGIRKGETGMFVRYYDVINGQRTGLKLLFPIFQFLFYNILFPLSDLRITFSDFPFMNFQRKEQDG
jgi:hypothetical protein